jgi:hypothetical protein
MGAAASVPAASPSQDEPTNSPRAQNAGDEKKVIANVSQESSNLVSQLMFARNISICLLDLYLFLYNIFIT